MHFRNPSGIDPRKVLRCSGRLLYLSYTNKIIMEKATSILYGLVRPSRLISQINVGFV